MAFTLYRNTDASAPVLSGTVGGLTTVLDACLVNGYGTKVGAGWTIAFTGTDRRAYRNNTITGSGRYFQILDNGPGAGGAREARLRGYETMTTVNSGTNPFPSATQLSAGVIIRKSIDLSSTSRNYWIMADNLTCYICIETGDGVLCWASFGDFEKRKLADAYNAYTIGRAVENDGTNFATNTTYDNFGAVSNNGGATKLWLDRDYSGAFTSNQGGVSKISWLNTAGTTMGGGGTQYPDGVNSRLIVERPIIHDGDTTYQIRGWFRGLYAPMHQRPLAHGDTCQGVGALNGRSFICLHLTGLPATNGSVLLQTN